MNVGTVDRGIRLTLGVACVAALGYHLLVARLLPLYGVVAIAVLILFFLKTGLTRVCPIMKAMGVSTNQKKG